MNAKHVSVEQPSGYISVRLGHKAHVTTADCPWQVRLSNLSDFKLHNEMVEGLGYFVVVFVLLLFLFSLISVWPRPIWWSH